MAKKKPGWWLRMVERMRADMEQNVRDDDEQAAYEDDRNPYNLYELDRAIQRARRPNVRAILEEERRRLEDIHREQMEMAAQRMLQQRLEQRLNPRIGTPDDTDPQENFLFRLMEMMRRRHGRGPIP